MATSGGSTCRKLRPLHFEEPTSGRPLSLPKRGRRSAVVALDASSDIQIDRRVWREIRNETAKITRNCHVTGVLSRKFSRSILIRVGDYNENAVKHREKTCGVIRRLIKTALNSRKPRWSAVCRAPIWRSTRPVSAARSSTSYGPPGSSRSRSRSRPGRTPRSRMVCGTCPSGS